MFKFEVIKKSDNISLIKNITNFFSYFVVCTPYNYETFNKYEDALNHYYESKDLLR